MTELPVAFNSGETVLRDTEAVYPKNSFLGLGYNLVFGHLWLTNQRVIFHGSLFGHTLVFPLSHISSAAPSERQIKTAKVSVSGADAFTQWSSLMLLTFDTGGREYFAVKDIAGWTEGIMSARGQAPAMEYVTQPNSRPGVETTPGQLVLWFVGAAAGICLLFACCAALTLFLPSIIAVMGTSGQ